MRNVPKAAFDDLTRQKTHPLTACPVTDWAAADGDVKVRSPNSIPFGTTRAEMFHSFLRRPR